MPTTNFSVTDAKVVWGGYLLDFAFGGSTLRQRPNGNGFNCRFVVTGTQCDFPIYGNNNNARVVVDGSASDIATGAAGFKDITLFSGLSDAAHEVWLTTTYVNIGNANSPDMKVTGAAPALAAVSGYDGYTRYEPDASGITRDNCLQLLTAEGNNNTATDQAAGTGARKGGHIRFKATCTSIYVWSYLGTSSGALRLIVDDDNTMGTKVTPTRVDIETWGWFGWTGLDGGTEHTYTIMYAHDGTGGGDQPYIREVLTVGGTMNSSAPATRNEAAFYGDSITSDSAYYAGDHGLWWIQKFCTRRTNKTGHVQVGIAGSAVQNSISGANAGETRTNDIVNMTVAPFECFIQYGTNDANDAGYSAAAFRTAYDNMLTALVSGLPSTKFKCMGMFDRAAGTGQTNRPSVNTQISNAVTAQANANVTYINTDNWITPATDTDDGLHPNATGAQKIAIQLAALDDPILCHLVAGGKLIW